MSREKPIKTFASPQTEELAEDLLRKQLEAQRTWNRLRSLTNQKRKEAPYRYPPSPELIQTLADSLMTREQQLEYKQRGYDENMYLARAMIAERKAKRETKEQAQLETRQAQLETLALEAETRVSEGLEHTMSLEDDVLFRSPEVLEGLGQALEAEIDHADALNQGAQTVVRLETSASVASAPISPLATHDETKSYEGQSDLHAQLEEVVGETLPQFNIKTDADTRAKEIGAVAFTQGDTIYFQSGKFDPSSVEGFKLLVHEATHIAQQAKGQAQPGIDSSPELERAAQQKADQVSSPAKAFSREELSTLTTQLSTSYRNLGSNPERFSSIAESWHNLPEQARKGVRGRFLMGRNENSLETIKLNEAFDARLNAGLTTKRLEEQTQVREQRFREPIGINVQFNVSSQPQLLPGLVGQQVHSNAPTIQRKETADAQKNDAQYIQAFKEAMAKEAIERLKENRKKLNSDLAALKNTDPSNPEWQRLRELSGKDGMLKERWQKLAEQLQQQVRQYDPNLSDIVTYPDIGLSQRRGQIESAIRFSMTQGFVYSKPQPTDANSAKKQNQENEAAIQTVLAPILKTLEAASFIEDVQKALRIAYPALGVLNTPGQGGAFAKTKNDAISNQQALTRVNSGFQEIHKSINDLEGQINQKDGQGKRNNVPVLELSAVMDAVFTQQGISEAARKSGDAKSKAVLDWLDKERLNRKVVSIGTGVVAGGAAIASLFTPAGWATLLTLGIGGGVGLAGAAYDVNNALTEQRAANAGRGGKALTNTSPEEARFNTVMSFVNLALGAFDAAMVAGAAGKALRSGELFESAARFGGKVLSRANPEQVADYMQAMQLRNAGKAGEANAILSRLKQQLGKNYDDLANALDDALKLKMRTGAQAGVAASPDSIRLGTVRMTEHPDFPKIKARLEVQGIAIRFSSSYSETRLVLRKVVDKSGKFLREEKFIQIPENARFLDFEHEVGHVDQIQRLGGKVKYTEKVFERDNGTLKQMNESQITNDAEILTGKQNNITEYHNRLVEFMRLAKRADSNPDIETFELLRQHAVGVREYKQRYGEVIFNRNTGKVTDAGKWAEENFGDISNLTVQFEEICKKLGF